MASKKEFKRKEKAKARKAKKEQRLESNANRRGIDEVNSLNLLAVSPESMTMDAGGQAAGEGPEAVVRRDAPLAGESAETADKAAMEQAEPSEEERLQVAEAERLRLEAEAVERARKMAEEAERARRIARSVETARREAELADKLHRESAAAEEARNKAEAEAALRAQRMAETAEQAKKMAAKVEEARQRDGFDTEDGMVSRDDDPVFVPPPPLEVEHPYWEKPAGVFDMMSGVPLGGPGGAPDRYAGGADGGEPAEPVLPVTCAEERNSFERGDFPEDDKPEAPAKAEPAETKPVPLEKRMYIVMVTPEVAPCAKVGGLGDVILGLGRELMKRGHGVEVICPMYSGMRYDLIYDLHEEYAELWCPHYNEWRAEKVFQGKVEGGLQVNFITGGTYTERPNIYGYEDDLQRFTYFSRQALEFMYKTNRRPDIIHCHDWATGLVPATLWDIYQKLGWDNSRCVYTIHNNECQGLCGFGDKLLGLIGLDVKNYHRPDRMQDDTHKNCINMMKGGIVYSNFVTTVSPTYAGELKTVAGGRGLEHTIARNSVKVGGVLNGIDYDSWNPRTDPKLAARYSEGEDFYQKYQNKKALREWLGLWDAWKPIVSVVTRLTHQKGLDLIKHAILSTLEMEGQFVLLGSAPDPKVNADFLRLQHDLRDNHDVNLYIGYHEDLSRTIYAGSDMFLVPSLYEPCGLTQMISLRYGTVPIVRETGGLVDTVFDLENSGRGLGDANGFTFRDATKESLDYGLSRAIRLWYDNPDAFHRLAVNGMRYDYSWRHPAEHYENIYNYIKA